MASPVEIERNLPDTLPADFGEWDVTDSQSEAPVAPPPRKPADTTPKESPQRESARREAEAVDFANKPFVAREVSREFEPPRNVTPFPEPVESPTTPRGIPAPVIRAPRTSPTPSPVAAPTAQDDSAFMRRMKSVDTVVDKLPADEAREEETSVSAVALLDRRPDRPLFSSVALEKEESSEDELRPTLLNELLDDEDERRTRRKWITTAVVFGGALLLVVFQLFHYYGSAAKIKHIVNTPQVAAGSPVPEPDPETVADVKPVETKPSAATQMSESDPEVEQVDDTPAKPLEKPPAAAQTQMMQRQLAAPTRLPQDVKTISPDDAPPPSSLGGSSIAALNGNSTVGNMFAGRSHTSVSGPKPVTVSAGVAVGMLVHQTQPLYPPIARSARVQGTVVLNATISRTGKVTNLKVASGPPMLRQAAIDAVKTWQYKPYTLNNEPTEVETTINVTFSIGG